MALCLHGLAEAWLKFKHPASQLAFFCPFSSVCELLTALPLTPPLS